MEKNISMHVFIIYIEVGKVEIKKGDIVGRKSYGKDIIFFVDRIIKVKNGKSYAILKRRTL